ncbi:hypothetical protein Tco_0066773, partial [Tanacetum coccineum]
VRVILPKKQFAKTQHAEETVTIANATQSLEASDSAEEQVNQPKTAEAEKSNHGDSDSESGLYSMPDNDLSDPLGHLHEELRTLNTKVDQLESSISKKVTDDIQSSIPSIVVNALKANLPGLLSEALKNTLPQMIKDPIQQSVQESIKEKLSLFDAQVQQTLQDQLPSILLKPMNKQFNAFNTLESHRDASGFHKLALVQSTVAINSQHVRDLRLMFKDMVLLLEAPKVFKRLMLKGRMGATTNSRVIECRTSPSDNEENALVLHASMEKSSVENTSEKKVSHDEPPVKKLKFLIPTLSSILSLTPLNSVLPEPIQKPNVTKMTIEQFTKHLNKTTSSFFSPTPPREPTLPRDLTPPRDESKGKEGQLTNEDVMAQVKEMKRLADLKAEKEKSEKSLQKIMNPATIRGPGSEDG